MGFMNIFNQKITINYENSSNKWKKYLNAKFVKKYKNKYSTLFIHNEYADEYYIIVDYYKIEFTSVNYLFFFICLLRRPFRRGDHTVDGFNINFLDL